MSYNNLVETVWTGSISLQISLSPDECRTYDESLPYIIQFPRLSYLPFLLPRLHNFFTPLLIDSDVPAHQGWFSYEGVPLKWQHPIGLLYDLFSGQDPTNLGDTREGARSSTTETAERNDDGGLWKLVVHFTDWPAEQLIPLDAEGKVHHDAFINSVKEADFLRNGTAKVMMSLSKHDSTQLWQSVQNHDMALFDTVNHKFLNPPSGTPLRHVPMKVYVPAASPSPLEELQSTDQPASATLKVVQKLIPPLLSNKELQTVGSALRSMLPSVFPSRRSYIYAQAVLHGAVLPLAAPVQELLRTAAYADGFLHVAVLMVS